MCDMIMSQCVHLKIGNNTLYVNVLDMDEKAPKPRTRETLIADIVHVGTEILDLDPATADARITEDPHNQYRATMVPENGLMTVCGPNPGDELPVMLAVTAGARRLT